MLQVVERNELWQKIVNQVRDEYAQLDTAEKDWIQVNCQQIGSLQLELDRLFLAGDGHNQCRDCRGDCCALGHNHLSLANLLLLVEAGELPPLDFNASCPLLSDRGCLLAPHQRPYPCISFLCDRIESLLSPADVTYFYNLEAELRQIYLAFAARYAGGGMHGLLLVAGRLQGQPFLRRIDIAWPL